MKNRLLFAECNLKCPVIILVLISHVICNRDKMTKSDRTLSAWLAFLPPELGKWTRDDAWPKAPETSRLKRRKVG